MHLMWHWAVRLVRRGWRTTGYVALLAGLAAGVTMATWSAARRTDSAFERRLEVAAIPEVQLNICPPDLTTVDEETMPRCASYLPREELTDLRALPQAEAAALMSFRGLTVAPADDPGRTVSASELASSEPSIHSIDGQQTPVHGRWYHADAVDEIVLNEHLSKRTGLAVGDRAVVTYWGPDEFGMFARDGDRYSGPSATVTVVGISRGVLDLTSTEGAIPMDGSRAFRPLDETAITDGLAFSGLSVRARRGMAADLTEAIDRTLAGRLYNRTPSMGPDEIDPIRGSIDYEATATLLLATLMAVAGGVFVGQAMARQSRREWSDLATLRALGLTVREARGAAAIRGAATGLAGAVAAIVVAVGLSPLGPIGVARRADPDSGVHVDGLVLAVGAAAVVAVVAAASPLGVASLRSRAALARGGSRAVAIARALPPPAMAGLSMSRARVAGAVLPLTTAVAGVAAAAASMVGAVVLVGSLDSLHSHPERFGAPWDLSLGATFGDDGPLRDAVRLLQTEADVVAAAHIVGTDIEIAAGDREVVVWSQAFVPLEGIARSVEAPVVGGRAPAADHEIALGLITMGDLGVEAGDTVEVRPTTSATAAVEMTVVGTTVVNDTFEASPGRGAVVTPGWIATAAPEATPDPTVVDLAPGADLELARAVVAHSYPGDVLAPVPQTAIRNLDRIRNLPYLLGGVVGALALASLVHALLLSVRRHRRPTAVLRGLGFTRRQVVAMMAVHATSFAVVAVAIGLPFGVMLGRWGWLAISDRMGVAGDPVIPAVSMALVALTVLTVSNLVALLPGWRSARVAPSQALRVE